MLIRIVNGSGVKHCLVFSALFLAGSNFGLDLYNFGIMFDLFPATLATLNIFGIVLGLFLTYKGLYFPSTGDAGSTGSIMRDYLWGTELYPRIGWGMGWDIKRFINCRFSMTYWQLAGLSFAYRSYTLHGAWGASTSILMITFTSTLMITDNAFILIVSVVQTMGWYSVPSRSTW